LDIQALVFVMFHVAFAFVMVDIVVLFLDGHVCILVVC